MIHATVAGGVENVNKTKPILSYKLNTTFYFPPHSGLLQINDTHKNLLLCKMVNTRTVSTDVDTQANYEHKIL